MHTWIVSGTILVFAAVTYAADSPVTYGGRDADASWRAEAHARIQQIRKASLKVEVVDAQGNPVRDAKVQVQQLRHAFGFGNILNPKTFQLEGEDGRKYREVFAQHFNKVTFEILPGGSRLEDYAKMIRFLVENEAAPDGIGFMGHFTEGTLRSIDGLKDVYDRFAKFGIPLQLTEFDIDTRDEQLQADYLRDVMTITFTLEL